MAATASTAAWSERRGIPPTAAVERDVASADGLRYRVRAIRPDDAARLVEFHRGLSAHSVYLRFFSVHPTLSDAEVARFTTVDGVNRLALVAAVDDRLIAVGRFDREPGSSEAEVAFVVADDYQHHGIGSLLLDELVLAARTRGVQVFRAETLTENRPMLDVFHHSGYPVSASIDGGVVSLRFPIAETERSRAVVAAREATRCPGGPQKTGEDAEGGA
jgi:GNAT superfamily N-acetyltransferase